MRADELRIETLLEEVVRRKASDLHIQVSLPPMFRIDGSLVPVPNTPVLDDATAERLIFAILDEDQQQILIKDKEFDFSFAFGNLGRFRVNAFHERGNIAAACTFCREKDSWSATLDCTWAISAAAVGICKGDNYSSYCLLDCRKI